MKLAQLAGLIRSKNAGPFILTFDIMSPRRRQLSSREEVGGADHRSLCRTIPM
jgi:hypothetical protein